MNPNLGRMLCVISGFLGILAVTAWANECTWNPPDGATWRWTNTVCWADGVAPAAGDTVILSAGKSGTINMDGASFSLVKIQLPGYASTYTYYLAATDTTGTCELTGGAEVSVGLNAYLGLNVSVSGNAGFAKTGEGTLELDKANTFTGSLSISAGRIITDLDAALGPVPETLASDAIILAGGELGNLASDFSLAATRGITVVGEGQLFGRNNKGITVNAPITGAGDLVIVMQTGYVRLNAANTYTGKTRVGDTGYFPYAGGIGRLYLDADGALPAATELVAASAGGGAEIHLGSSSQTVAALTLNGAFWLYGTASLSYGGDGNSFTNAYLDTGSTLAYTGTGTVAPGFKAASMGTFAVEFGTLSIASLGTLGANSYRVGNAITVGTMDAASFGNTFTLTGDVAMDASALVSGLDVQLTGSLLSDGAAAPYTLTVTGAPLRFGGSDKFAVMDAVLADNEGITLENRIWLTRALVGSHTVAASAVFAGPGAAVILGNQVLDGTNVCLTASNALGTGMETVTVSNSGSLILLATSGNPLPTYDMGYTMTAAYAVTLDSTSTLQLGGYGTVAFSGSVAGSGTLKVTGAANLTGADLRAFTGTIVLDGGVILVDKDAEQTFSQTISGKLEKRGEGELILAGTQGGNVNLTVTEGTARLAAAAAEVTNVVIGAAGRLVLDGSNGDQIADAGSVQINGVLDLNGRSETVHLYYTASGNLVNPPIGTAQIINSSASEATLSASSRTPFVGKVTETVGKITLRQTGDYLMPFGTLGAIAPSKVVMEGSAIFLPYTQYSTFAFVFKRPRTDGNTISLSEISLTYNGVPLVPGSYASASATSQYGDTQVSSRVIDGLANTSWRSGMNTTNATIWISVNGQQKVNGYRFCTGYDRNMDPADWEVWVSRSDNLWHLVDVRKDAAPSAPNDWRNNNTGNFFFSQDYPQNVLAATTAVDLAAKSVFRVSGTDTTAFGALTGSGLVQLERGSFFAAADLSGFDGRFTTTLDSGREAKVLLDGETGAAEQPVRATNSVSSFLSIASAKTNAVSLLVDDSYLAGCIAYGRLDDGAGKLGFVKRGTGTRSIAYSSAENTGDTRIEGGTLVVCGKRGAAHARYIRFTPSAYFGKDSNGFFYGMNEFILLSSGNKVVWPSGTSVANSNGKGFHATATAANLIDGNSSTRCLVATDKTTLEYPSLTFDTITGVTFDSYEWYVPFSNNTADMNRVVTAWTLSVSNDGVTWDTIDTETYIYNKVYSLQLVGPYSLGGTSVSLSAGATIASSFFAGTTDRSTRAPALKSRYFKFDPYETRNTADSVWRNTGYQLTEFQLYRDGKALQWGNSATASAALAPYAGYPYSMIVDNVLTSTGDANRGLSMTLPNPIIIDAGKEVTFDAYGYVTAPNTAERDPISWNFYVSTTGTDGWVLVDNQNALFDVLTTDRNTAVGPWSVANKFHDYDTGTSDALTDFAPLFIADGATLELQTGYEAFGPLTGIGTLTLDSAIADINGFAGAAFTGSVTGTGTFCKSGVATQTVVSACSFVGALQVNGGVLDVSGSSFTGVDALSLTGGVFRADSATFGGSALTVSFNGGAYGATCDNVGELVIQGSVLLDIPESPVLPYIKTLFTFSRIDADSVAALKAATLTHAVPKGAAVYVQVSDSAATLVISRSGTLSVLR